MIVGLLLEKESGVGPNKSMIYHFKTSDDKNVAVWGSTVLDDRMRHVDLMEIVRITYKGEVLNSKKQKLHKYLVERAKTTKVPSTG